MPTSVSFTIDNVGAAMAEVIQPYLVDIIFTDFALLAILEEKGKIVTPDPAIDINWPINVGKLNTGTFRGGVYRYPGQEKQIFDRAKVQWTNAYCDVVVSGTDVLKARGPHAAFQLTDALKQNAKMSISDAMGDQVYADGVETSTTAPFDGLGVGVDDGVLFPTYANVPRTTYTTWKAYVDGTVNPFTLPLLTTFLGHATVASESPDLVVTTQDIWNSAQNRAQAQQVFDKGNSGNSVAALGFRVISHLGASIVHDSKCASGNMWGINTDYIELAVMPDRVWAWTGWEKVPGADGFEAQFLLMGNWKVLSPRMFFRGYNIS